ncbi:MULTISPECIES: sigma E protease regulator RseP [unclassified Cobetia]|uniref:sigma E protease regulator RseP n=1 Tax=unclassified Cobetia TaxID=2609414 RepID=UPI00159D1216|nr:MULTISPECIES: sigma E protease regulator RseP [unclassified Cobetia]MCO7233362.1 sigma E protease regulator RseP [Cobetia sp. Dlab-2-AX]MCO7236574.1 sigma E protease regulator RseP [Cobetia sp. Dlab-2-U]NVN57215.1 sigma E protease regulator RseP [bacterium Scap17]
MGVIQNILAVIVVLGVLITIHEYGHFWVARRCGIKVLRFSIGFGKPFWSWTDRHGTEYGVAAIPLGGYVKMLDEREGPVDPAERHLAFNTKSVWKRIAVVSAGPLANFLLAIVAYWALFVAGTTTVVPMVGAVAPDSPAGRAGLAPKTEIVAINGEATPSWDEVNLRLIGAIGDDSLTLTTRAEGASTTREQSLDVTRFLVDQDPPRPLVTLGITAWRPQLPAVLGRVLDGGAAQAAGLQAGDRIVSINGTLVVDWIDFVERVRGAPGETLSVLVARDGKEEALSLTPASNSLDDGRVVGQVGASVQNVSWPEQYQRELSFGPLAAVGQAVGKTGEMTVLTLDSIRKMLVGLIAPSNLSGPITIARIAGDTARSGLEAFLGFMAYLSISLGVLNLLPIPVLDGGHLLFYLVEAVRGKPLSQEVQNAGLKIGMALVGSLMLMAIYFDLMRLW